MDFKTSLKFMLPGIAGLLFALPALAGSPVPDSVLANCATMGEDYGIGTGMKDLITECRAPTLMMSSGTANRLSTDGLIHVFAYGSFVFIDRPDLAHPNADGTFPVLNGVISGKNTFFANVTSVAIDEANKEIYVLDSSTKTISVYPLAVTGNIRPWRFIQSDALESASALAIDPVNNELLVLSTSHNSITIYGRLADVDGGARSVSSTAARRSIDLSGIVMSGSSLVDLAVSPQHSEIYVLDQGSGQILVIDRSAAIAATQGSFGGGGLGGSQTIVYSPSDDTIRAVNGDGSKTSYPAYPPAKPNALSSN